MSLPIIGKPKQSSRSVQKQSSRHSSAPPRLRDDGYVDSSTSTAQSKVSLPPPVRVSHDYGRPEQNNNRGSAIERLQNKDRDNKQIRHK